MHSQMLPLRITTSLLPLCLLVLFPLSGRVSAADASEVPVVLGRGVGLFQVGKVLAQDDFENLDKWDVQIQQRAGGESASVSARDNTLDCILPGRGCTVWFREKLPTRVTITYDVLCPTHQPAIKGLVPRDVNNFWMASDPLGSDEGLLDASRYDGKFGSYDKMHGYYASTGGRDNQTTRMRRYPREVDGQAVDHLALNDKDGKPGYLIVPDQVMKVQLVAYDDVIQYIVDGKLIYQVGRDDPIEIESRDAAGKSTSLAAKYELDRFPVYREGYFGFRMVSTHHIYSNFLVHALDPDKIQLPRPIVRVASLDALREAVRHSHQQIVLEPGVHTVKDNRGFRFSGAGNDVDLAGCSIKVPLEAASGRTLFRLTGDNITLRGGTIEDTYPDEKTGTSRFGQSNRFGGMNEMSISGDDCRIVGLKMAIRGSFPYGYGNMYGIGRDSIVPLQKHCGIQITGDRTLVDSCDIKMEAFGHAIYVQGGARTTVRNTVIEGTVRPSNDLYQEVHSGSLAKRFDYQLQWPEEVRGLHIPRDHMINCTEDGIRAYKGAGEMIVENCTVKKCRGGIKLYMAKRATVSNCTVLDCVVQGYSLPRGGSISNSAGNAAYGPLLYVHFDSHSNQAIDLRVLPAPHSLGDHPLAAINGQGHNIQLTAGGDFAGVATRPIIVGYPMRFDFLSTDYPDVPAGLEEHFAKFSPGTYKATGITLNNQTAHPVVLGALAQANQISSVGPVRDLGVKNNVVENSEAKAPVSRRP